MLQFLPEVDDDEGLADVCPGALGRVGLAQVQTGGAVGVGVVWKNVSIVLCMTLVLFDFVRFLL